MNSQINPKRGDVMVIYRPLVIDVLNQGRSTVERYCVAIVSKAARRRLVNRVYLGHGNDIAIEDHQVKAWTPAATVDGVALSAWLESDDSLTTFSTFEDARQVVVRFRK